MSQASQSAAEKMISLLRRASSAAVASGLGGQLIEDQQFVGDSIIIRGQKVANFGLCSYLGLGTDERVIAGAIDATRRFGTSYSSSIAYTALGLYGDLRERLTEMFDAEVILAGTTTLAHLAALPPLIPSQALVLVDGQVHASVLSVLPTLRGGGSEVEVIPHSDLERLGLRLEEAGTRRPVWYLTDGVFSMHGDSAPVERIHELLSSHTNLHVYVDDAHGFGWDGPKGRGNYLKRSGWHERLVISVGMAKSFGTAGGIIATSNGDFADRIRLAGSPLVFGGPIPPPTLGASIASAEIHLSSGLLQLQRDLGDRIRFVNEFSVEIGLPLMVREHNPLWFMEVGDFGDSFALAEQMKASGFYLNPAVFPAVPRGHGGVRFTVTNYNSLTQIEDMLTCLNTVRLEMFGKTEVEFDLGSGDSSRSRDEQAQRSES